MGKKGRNLILLVGAGMVLLAVLGWAWLHAGPGVPDPIYKGKPLSYWLQGYSTGVLPVTAPKSSEATEAVYNVGTNGLPLLLHMLGARDSRLKMRLNDWIWRVTKNRNLLMNLDQRNEAALALVRLGKEARTAVPGLIQILQNYSNTNGQYEAAFVFGSNPDIFRSKEAVQAMCQAATGPNPVVRWISIVYLYNMSDYPDIVVPTLIQALKDPVALNREHAVMGLREFGRSARPAVPALLALLNDTNKDVSTVFVPAAASFGRANVGPNILLALKQIDTNAYAIVMTNLPGGPEN